MPDLRPVFAPLMALALATLVLSSMSPDRGRDDRVIGAVATIEAADAEPMQASCGDGRCAPPEDCRSCPSDCGSCCGDGRCSAPEDCNSCPSDCGSCCGDGRCSPPEDERSCPRDC